MTRTPVFARALLVLMLAAGAASADAAVALIYHRFDDARYPSTNLSLNAFREQLQWFADNAFEVWSASQLVERLSSGEAIPDRVAVITIDDGYASLRGAAVLLEQFGFPFSVFVSTGPIDDRAADMLDWDGLRDVCARGGEILNHGVDHDSLLARPGEADDARRQRIRDQLASAQVRIDAEVPADCRARIFSYPYGEYDRLAVETLAGAGYPAFGQQSGPIAAWNSLQALPRFPVNQSYADAPLMQVKFMSLPFPAVLQPQDTVVLENPPELRLGIFPGIGRVNCFDGQGRPLERKTGADAYTFQAPAPLARGRNRYNCTCPSDDGTRFHWLSQFWFVP